jgi:hypothetical protein
MADATLSRTEIAAVRRIVERLGLNPAADVLGVGPQTLTVILAGRYPRAGTVALLRASLPKVKA